MVRSFVEDRFETEETYKYGADLCKYGMSTEFYPPMPMPKDGLCVERRQHEQ